MTDIFIQLILGIILVALVFWFIKWFELPQMVFKIAVALVVLVAALWLIKLIGSVAGIPAFG